MMDLVKKVEDHVGVKAEKFYKTTLFRGDALLLGLNCLEPGQVQKPHVHDDQDKFYYVVAGNGRFTLGTDAISASTGEVVWAPAGFNHGVANESDCQLTLLVGIAPAP
ncbi:MAG: cupin domain-containing protein [Chloroflexi bacterium]|nr:cupin domain-containing protein [Chloroflexota bacterium]